VDPRQRFTIGEVLERLAAIGETRGYQLKSGLKINTSSHVAPARPPVPAAPPSQPSPQLPRRPPPPSSNTSSPATPRHMAPRTPPAHRPAVPPNANHYAPPSQSVQPGLFSSLKGGAGSLFKNIKVIVPIFEGKVMIMI